MSLDPRVRALLVEMSAVGVQALGGPDNRAYVRAALAHIDALERDNALLRAECKASRASEHAHAEDCGSLEQGARYAALVAARAAVDAAGLLK